MKINSFFNFNFLIGDTCNILDNEVNIYFIKNMIKNNYNVNMYDFRD